MSSLDPKIIQATIRLLASSGYKGATTRKIAQEAGISPATIFRVFGDKNNLLRAVFQNLLPTENTIDPSPLLVEPNIADGLARLLKEYIGMIVRYLPAIKLAAQMPDDPDFQTDPDMALKPYVDQLSRCLKNLHAQRRIAQADFDSLARLTFSFLLRHAPQLAAADQPNGYDDKAASQLAGKYAIFLERKLKVSRTVNDAAAFPRKKENKPADIRENNLKAVLRMFMDADRLSAPDLQKEIHLSKTTMLKLVSQLVEDGLLVDLGVDPNVDERGRPPSYYRINGDYGYGVVFQFAPDSILAAIANMKNEIIHIHRSPITDQLTLDDALSIIVHSFHDALESKGIAEERVRGVCVATGGPTSEDDGSIAYIPRYHNWPKHAPIRKLLQERLPTGLTILVNNEMYCQSVGEQYFGKAYGMCSALVFEAGDKLGSGIIMDHRLLHGAHSLAGEIGHMKLDPKSDVQCVCGAYGCFRALVHSDRILFLARNILPKHPESILRRHPDLNVQDVFSALAADDPISMCVMDQIAQWMGIALSNLMLTIDPEIIVLQGIYTKAGPVFLDMVRKYVVEGKFPYLGELDLAIDYSELGDKACLLGGSRLITESIIEQYANRSSH